MPLPWIIYTRVSTEDQAREGVSLDAQRDACESMARALTLPVAQVLTDAGISAKNLDGRPAVQAAMAAVDAGQVSGVIVYKLDRLTRSRRDLEDLLDRFARVGAGLISVSEKLDTSSPMGRFFVAMLGAIAQWERETIAERVTMGIRHRKAAGGFVGGTPPAGLRSVPADGGGRRLEVDPETGPKVAAAWTVLLQGGSLRQVADHLRASGLPGKWSPASARKLLLNPRYVGHLVTEADQRAAEAEMRGRFNPHAGQGVSLASITHAQRPWLLSGIGRCATCGGTLMGTTVTNGSGKAFHYYRCGTRHRQGPKACPQKDLPALPWEAGVVDALVRGIAQDGRLGPALGEMAMALRSQAGPLTEERAQIQMTRDRQAAELNNLVALAAAGGLTAQALARPLAERQQALNDLDRQLAKIDGTLAAVGMDEDRVAGLRQVLTQAISTLPDLPPEEQRTALHLLLDHVVLRPIDKEKGEVHLAVNLPRQTSARFVQPWPMVERSSWRTNSTVSWADQFPISGRR